MSYDIFCYRSKSGIPDEDEAHSMIEIDNDKYATVEDRSETKLAILKALVNYNPDLIAYDHDFGDISKLSVDILQKEKNKFREIEINPREGEIAIRMTIYGNHVYINFPYWYKGDDAVKLFEQIKSYIKLIRETSGFFVFDPQTGKTFDPAENNFDGLDKYLSMMVFIDELIRPDITKDNKSKKPWWKIW